MVLFIEIEKNFQNSYITAMHPEYPENPKEEEIRGFVLPDSKSYCKSTVIKTIQSRPKDRHTDQGHRIESPENDHLNRVEFPQGHQENTMQKASSQQMVLGELNIHVQRNDIRPSSYITQKNQHEMD